MDIPAAYFGSTEAFRTVVQDLGTDATTLTRPNATAALDELCGDDLVYMTLPGLDATNYNVETCATLAVVLPLVDNGTTTRLRTWAPCG